ncbi:LPS assembly lipoprotein LptE [Chelativorans sp. SCAU2101]|uniref:LPS assembly lipoprotein LptE n=1 Tax=Chelativorans petroleitrophicus TaxID=2975484 RepID=A0A9X3B8D7_9HYPH|nr:LPS assembly lipoprotein LptE [Chelativorans petroleitrophicus]
MILKIRALIVIATALAAGLAAGCTVRPLLGTEPGEAGEEIASTLSSVSVKPVDTREAQEVRNHLIFLFQGGDPQPADPTHTLDLAVSRRVTSAVQVQRGNENEPTAGTVTLIGQYRLTDAATGEVVAQGRREVSAGFDRPRQEYAVLRAQRDAEDRAARELAELIRLAVAQDLARLDVR